MANYCILRMAKIKTDGNVAASLQHQYRERETINADIDKTELNENSNNSVEQAMAMYREKLPEKVRSNAVKAIELVMTASPEALAEMTVEQQKEYFNDCIDFVKTKYGAENVFQSSVHFDEQTPHVHVMFVPKIDGKLNCKKLFGTDNSKKGTTEKPISGRQKLRDLQDDFYSEVGKKHGFERGQKGSIARHQTVKRFYGEVLDIDEALELPKKKILEKDEDYQIRFKEQIEPLLKKLTTYDQMEKVFFNASNQIALADERADHAEKKFADLQNDFEKKVSDGYYKRIAEARDQQKSVDFIEINRRENALENEKEEFEKQKIKEFETKNSEISKLKQQNSELQLANNQHLQTIFNQNKIVEDLKTETENETKRADKAEKHVSDIERRIDQTLHALGGNAQEIFDKKYYEIKDQEERPRNRSSGFERS